jgi:hypothetical protein
MPHTRVFFFHFFFFFLHERVPHTRVFFSFMPPFFLHATLFFHAPFFFLLHALHDTHGCHTQGCSWSAWLAGLTFKKGGEGRFQVVSGSSVLEQPWPFPAWARSSIERTIDAHMRQLPLVLADRTVLQDLLPHYVTKRCSGVVTEADILYINRNTHPPPIEITSSDRTMNLMRRELRYRGEHFFV